jgi:hypothetical protein
MAIPWRAAGFTPERAAALINRGVTDPTRAPGAHQDESQEEALDEEDQDGYK